MRTYITTRRLAFCIPVRFGMVLVFIIETFFSLVLDTGLVGETPSYPVSSCYGSLAFGTIVKRPSSLVTGAIGSIEGELRGPVSGAAEH